MTWSLTGTLIDSSGDPVADAAVTVRPHTIPTPAGSTGLVVRAVTEHTDRHGHVDVDGIVSVANATWELCVDGSRVTIADPGDGASVDVGQLTTIDGSITPTEIERLSALIASVHGVKGDPGADGAPGAPGADGHDGRGIETITADGGVATVTLTDGTATTITLPAGPAGSDGTDGAPGRDGTDGAQGAPGRDGVDGRTPSITMIGDQIAVDGTVVSDHLTGPQGAPGQPGVQGQPGADGHSPAVAMSGDQITVDGTVVGPHLTGPAGAAGKDSTVTAASGSNYNTGNGTGVTSSGWQISSGSTKVGRPLADAPQTWTYTGTNPLNPSAGAPQVYANAVGQTMIASSTGGFKASWVAMDTTPTWSVTSGDTGWRTLAKFDTTKSAWTTYGGDGPINPLLVKIVNSTGKTIADGWDECCSSGAIGYRRYPGMVSWGLDQVRFKVAGTVVISWGASGSATAQPWIGLAIGDTDNKPVRQLPGTGPKFVITDTTQSYSGIAHGTGSTTSWINGVDLPTTAPAFTWTYTS